MSAPQAPTPHAYGGFWIRVVAFFFDGLVIGIIASLVSPWVGAPLVDTSPGGNGGFGIRIDILGGGASSSLMSLLYFVGFWAWRGQTPGMLLFGMHLVRVGDGSRPDWIVALVRYLGLVISFALLLLGVIWVAFDARKQGWMDKLAGTVVLRDAG
jgi:uncharacterized RDD family membrane protein YckC